MTNNPAKYGGLDGYGLRVVERVAMPTITTPENVTYLRTKRDRLGHLLDLDDPSSTTDPTTDPIARGAHA
jgi:3,4-dihydroxy 2-butanone 4-phosphate synthase/GTP cyclohydrolase II